MLGLSQIQAHCFRLYGVHLRKSYHYNTRLKTDTFFYLSSGAPPSLTYQTEQNTTERIAIHPSSVNYSCKKYAARWLVYHERVQTTSVFVRDCRYVLHFPNPPHTVLPLTLVTVQTEAGDC